MINKPTNAHEIPWDGLPHFFLNTSFLTSGQNSMNALLPIFPSTPYRQRRAAMAGVRFAVRAPRIGEKIVSHVSRKARIRWMKTPIPARSREGTTDHVLHPRFEGPAWRGKVARVFTPNRPQRSLHRIARRNPGQPHAIAFPKSSPVWTVLLGRVSRCPQGGAQGSVKKQAARSYRGFHEPLEALRPVTGL